MFGRKPAESLIEHEFEIDISKNDGSIFMELEWGHNRRDPERLTLKFLPAELKELISRLENELTTVKTP